MSLTQYLTFSLCVCRKNLYHLGNTLVILCLFSLSQLLAVDLRHKMCLWPPMESICTIRDWRLSQKCKQLVEEVFLYRHCVCSEEVQRTSVPAWCRWGCWVRLAGNQGHSCTAILYPQGTSPCWFLWGLPSCSGPCMASRILRREDQRRRNSKKLLFTWFKATNMLCLVWEKKMLVVFIFC